MKQYKIAISNEVFNDLENIGNFILSKYTQDAVNNYLTSLYKDISTLKYLAEILPYSQSETIQQIHPRGKRLLSKNKHWNIVFHILNDYVIVDRIIASSLIK